MANLKRASAQFFSRPDDERFSSLDALIDHSRSARDQSQERWQLPGPVSAEDLGGTLMVDALTRSTRSLWNLGDRIEHDSGIGALRSLAV